MTKASPRQDLNLLRILFACGSCRAHQDMFVAVRASVAAREAIARFVDGNSEKLQGWLDEIAERDGLKAAFQCLVDLLEFHCPKLARQEYVGEDGGPMTITVKWSDR